MDTHSLCDAHNHLQDSSLRPHHDRVFADLQAIGIAGAVVNGTTEKDWPAVASLAETHPWIIPSYGLHPWYIRERSADWENALIQRLEQTAGPVAIGEIGLDRWIEDYDLDDQIDVFSRQLRIAAERNLPVTIHCLQAWGALHEVLRREPLPERGFLIHAYGGPAELVGPFARLGASFSFNGSILHERKAARRRIFAEIPAERLLLETDAPAMPPPPDAIEFPLPDTPDGEPLNHPANLRRTCERLAPLRGLTPAALAELTARNFRALFG